MGAFKMNMIVKAVCFAAAAMAMTACSPNHTFTESVRAPAAIPVAPEPAPEPPPVEVQPPPPVQEIVEKSGEVKFEALEEDRMVYTMLDVSYSMRDALGTSTRYEVAKSLFLRLVNNDIKDGTEFALRVFGHGVLASCTTDLMVPVGTLNRQQVTQTLNNLTTATNGNTAITASLRAARNELRQSDASVKQIVLITDGEETCDADRESPLAEITALVNEDPAVRLMIVGLKLEDPILVAKYQAWAQIGRGTYFDARNPAGLDAAMKNAILAPTRFEAYQNGVLKIAGNVDDSSKLKLKEGKYDFKLTSPAKTVWFRDVEVREDRPVTVRPNTAM